MQFSYKPSIKALFCAFILCASASKAEQEEYRTDEQTEEYAEQPQESSESEEEPREQENSYSEMNTEPSSVSTEETERLRAVLRRIESSTSNGRNRSRPVQTQDPNRPFAPVQRQAHTPDDPEYYKKQFAPLHPPKNETLYAYDEQPSEPSYDQPAEQPPEQYSEASAAQNSNEYSSHNASQPTDEANQESEHQSSPLPINQNPDITDPSPPRVNPSEQSDKMEKLIKDLDKIEPSKQTEKPYTSPISQTYAKGNWTGVELRVLNKSTTKVEVIKAPLGVPTRLKSLDVLPRSCAKSRPEDPPEVKAFLEISELKPGEDKSRIFSGWIFASTPGVSGLEHPIYDIVVQNCVETKTAPEPEAPKENKKADNKSRLKDMP